MKAKPPNTLGYLQSFIASSHLKILWSTNNENPFILSHLDNNNCIDNWPTNFPGPTVIVSSSTAMIKNDFPWNPKILNVDDSMSFKEILSIVLNDPVPSELPIINENMLPSEFIPEELIESFVIETF